LLSVTVTLKVTLPVRFVVVIALPKVDDTDPPGVHAYEYGDGLAKPTGVPALTPAFSVVAVPEQIVVVPVIELTVGVLKMDTDLVPTAPKAPHAFTALTVTSPIAGVVPNVTVILLPVVELVMLAPAGTVH
jgi:hypothetical protein